MSQILVWRVVVLLAYFDPGSASLLMQALVGGSAGLIVLGRYFWATLVSRISPAPAPSSSATVLRAAPSQPTLSEALSGEFRFNIT